MEARGGKKGARRFKEDPSGRDLAEGERSFLLFFFFFFGLKMGAHLSK